MSPAHVIWVLLLRNKMLLRYHHFSLLSPGMF